jgi:hypothetical protein
MKHIVKNEKDWHALRSQFVTASEAAILVGADPYSSPAKIKNPGTFAGNHYTKVGQLLEPVVVTEVNKLLGTNFELYENSKGWKEFYTNGHLGATPDAHDNRTHLLECKTVNSKTYLKYSAVPPSKYLIQLMTQVHCSEVPGDYHFLALMDTKLKTEEQYNKFLESPNLDQAWSTTIYKVWKNEEICTILKEQAEKFKTQKSFRVSSKIKQKVKLLLNLSYRRLV